ncbi:hypothetical protein WN51_01644 [Melipona quadrifasciata]|uniref:Uncharacterized protein n=1 Tax=Melipona quadrifasciata TaxID=166423 RepID=A0A0N0U417_9HYME|nr:hypothetical protein WN51_01644 [Melipona quadrifasciata]
MFVDERQVDASMIYELRRYYLEGWVVAACRPASWPKSFNFADFLVNHHGQQFNSIGGLARKGERTTRKTKVGREGGRERAFRRVLNTAI